MPATRHPNLDHLLPALAWFHAAALSPPVAGTAANDNRAAVPDRNPRPDSADSLLRALPSPTRVYCRTLRRGGRSAGAAQRFNEWTPPRGPLAAWGALRFAARGFRELEFVRVGGELVPRSYRVPAGAITHVWGRPQGQERGRARLPTGADAVAARADSMLWFCALLGALPAGRPRKLMRRRRPLPPTPPALWAAVRGAVPLDEARAAAGLPPADRCLLPGLPAEPQEPARLFLGMVAGRGSRADGMGTPSAVKRPDPDAYNGDAAIVDHATLEMFAADEPESYSTLAATLSAGSMSDLVASNDNHTGKRALVRAATALQKYLAA